jgi:hypothetical protein
MRLFVWVCWVGLISLTAISLDKTPAAAEPGAAPRGASFAELGQIKKFVSVAAQTQGTAEKLRLRSGELTDVMRALFLKSFPGVAFEMSGGPSAEGPERPRDVGFFICEVWTVGEEYMAAYHLDCNAGSYATLRTPVTLWNWSILGYGPKDDVPDAIRKGLQNMIEEFSIAFYKARGEGVSR